MAQLGNTQDNSSRALALARRKAMSGLGKAAIQSAPAAGSGSSRRSASAAPAKAVAPSVKAAGASARPVGNSSRAASLARRRAMSTQGKKGLNSSDRTRTMVMASKDNGAVAKPAHSNAANAANASEPDCGCGCKGEKKDAAMASGSRQAPSAKLSTSLLKRKVKKVMNTESCRAASLARRKAMSVRGKAGISSTGMSQAQTARASNPELSSRELAKVLRDQRSRKGACGQKKSESPRRMRPARNKENGPAEDAPWKVGASNTTHGQTVTGTMVGRSQSVTGDEASTCRDVTGTEYMGADLFQQFCQAEPAKTITRSGVSSTGLGNAVTGNQIGRSQKVTGDEPGTCQQVTGSEYVGSAQSGEFCGVDSTPKAPLTAAAMTSAMTSKGKSVTGNNVGRSDKVTGDEQGMSRDLTGTQYTKPSDIGNAPRKVGVNTTLRGSSVTGTTLGGREKMTGDEVGNCRNVTGDEYLGQEHFSTFCDAPPKPSDQKVGFSLTAGNNALTGSITGRSGMVTGDEPGTCKAVTGTPYASLDQAQNYCDTSASTEIEARTRPVTGIAGPSLSGIQPGVGGVMTGAGKGACESVTGTPYVGSDQFSAACPQTASSTAGSEAAQASFQVPRRQTSVMLDSEQVSASAGSGVTGNRYEAASSITGPFGMAGGKVTGTEEARFGNPAEAIAAPQVLEAEELEGRVKSRITGEGQDSGLKITGDDWERNGNVTGTEGRSASRRNPTIRTAMNSAAQVEIKRNEEIPVPNSKVTGGSGNTEKGSLITYSGGARG